MRIYAGWVKTFSKKMSHSLILILIFVCDSSVYISSIIIISSRPTFLALLRQLNSSLLLLDGVPKLRNFLSIEMEVRIVHLILILLAHFDNFLKRGQLLRLFLVVSIAIMNTLFFMHLLAKRKDCRPKLWGSERTLTCNS